MKPIMRPCPLRMTPVCMQPRCAPTLTTHPVAFSRTPSSLCRLTPPVARALTHSSPCCHCARAADDSIDVCVLHVHVKTPSTVPPGGCCSRVPDTSSHWYSSDQPPRVCNMQYNPFYAHTQAQCEGGDNMGTIPCGRISDGLRTPCMWEQCFNATHAR